MSELFAQSLVIIPTYNESSNVLRMIETVFSISSDLSVLIVDDNSPDGTAQLVENAQTTFPNLHLLKREGKLGLGTAYTTGFKWGLDRNFEYLFEMDCDFSHDPNDIPHLLEATRECDVAIGSRYLGGIRIINWPIERLFLSYGASIYVRVITRMPLFDPTGGFKCFKANALRALELDQIFSNGYSFQIELNYRLWKKNFKIKEVPIIFTERKDGQSKMTGAIVREAIFSVFRLRFFIS